MTPSDSSYSIITLTAGQFALVDPADMKELSGYKWQARWARCTKSFYASRNLPAPLEGTILMHRQILGLKNLDPLRVDHINGDTLDNRRSNLRLATAMQNSRNRKINSNNSSGLKGVHWHKGHRKWGAKIGVNWKQIGLGYFDTKEAAYAAYCEAALRYYGQFARL